MRPFLVAAIVMLALWAPQRTVGQRTREDGRCGRDFPADDGGPADCEYIEPFPTCCMENAHCGWQCDSALSVVVSSGGKTQQQNPAAAPAAAAPTTAKPKFVSNGKYRPDGRCGNEFPTEDGSPAECDPNSEFWCCSEFGFCGGTQEHCFCDTCVNYRPISLTGNGKVRSDRRCGAEFALEDGSPAECDGNSANFCCSSFGYCGPADHCGTDYRTSQASAPLSANPKVRGDRRCGTEFPLPDGSPSECDPNSINPCCSKWGYCGPGADHCSCAGCKDFRSSDQKLADFVGKVRTDRRCGPDFPLPDGSPSQCDGESENYCCSKWGYCGGDAEHCDCPTCFNYKLLGGSK